MSTNDPMFSNNEEETPMPGMNSMMGKKENTMMGGSRRRSRRSKKSRKSKRSRTVRRTRRR
jgi:hypothetical protein